MSEPKVNTKKAKELLQKPKKVVITTHKSPDGDAIGSSLALYHYLKKKKHQVSVIVPDQYPEFLYWIPGNEKILVYDKSHKKCEKLIAEAEIIFSLDYNSLKRIGDLGELVKNSKAQKWMIDHHQQPDDLFHFAYWDVKASSTSQLVYDFIEEFGDLDLLDKGMAEGIYVGIMTDTGSFRFSSTSPKTHRTVAHLMELGIVVENIHSSIYDNNSVDRQNLIGYCLSEKLKYFPDYNVSLIDLSADEQVRYNCKKGDTEGIVNLALSIKGVKLAAFIREEKDEIRLSLRSKGNFSVNEFSRKHFNGGGHTNAAGGIFDGSLDEAVIHFINLLPEYRKSLSE